MTIGMMLLSFQVQAAGIDANADSEYSLPESYYNSLEPKAQSQDQDLITFNKEPTQSDKQIENQVEENEEEYYYDDAYLLASDVETTVETTLIQLSNEMQQLRKEIGSFKIDLTARNAKA